MNRRILAAALAAAIFSSCGRPGRESEPNDHFTQATQIPSSGKAAGTLGSPGDTDWHKLTVAREAGVLSLHLGGIRDADFVVSVQDKERVELKRYDETGTGGDEEALDLGVKRGDYYIVVSNKNPKAANPEQEYVLRVKVDPPESREAEPNDKALSANLLPLNGVVRGHYFPTRNLLSEEPDQLEEDWFRLEQPKPGLYSLSAELSEVPKADAVLEVYDANGYKLKDVDAGGPGESESLKDFGVKGPASLWLRLRTKTRGGGADAPYELLTELRPYDGRGEFEPNDQRLDATAFERDEVAGRVVPAGDADWYKVSAATDAKMVLRADLSGVPGMDLQLSVADELGRTLLTVDNMGKEQPEVLTGLGVRKGEYFLVVSEKSGKAADARHPYTLAKSLAPFAPGLEFELNDSTPTAQALKVGESLDGYLAPKGDLDYYEFNVYKKGLAIVELTGVINVRFGLTLIDQDRRELQTAAARKPGESLAFERELDAGTYSLRLRAEDPGQSNVRDKYTLRVRMR